MRDLRKVLVLSALFWGAPLFAEQRSETEQRAGPACHYLHAKASAAHYGCPDNRARGSKQAAEKGGGVSFPPAEYPPAELFLFDVGRRIPKYFP